MPRVRPGARLIPRRGGATALGLALLVLFGTLYRLAPGLYHASLTALGFRPYAFPFLDTHYLLAGATCFRRGIDVYVTDPCDVLGRPHIYSPLWLRLPLPEVSPFWTNVAGLILAAGFLLALAALPVPRRPRDLALMLLATASTATLFAVERGNSDLAIFALVVIAGRTVLARSTLRLAAYPILLGAALLKFYPAVTLVLILRERPRIAWGLAAGAASVLILFALDFHAELGAALPNIPNGDYFSNLFGAVNLPYGVLQIIAPGSGLLMHRLLFAVPLAWAVRAALRRAAAPETGAGLTRLTQAERVMLLLGAMLIGGCFLAGQSVAYRAIYLLLCLPGLTALPSGRAAATVSVLLMWEGLLRQALLAAAGISPAVGLALWLLWFVRELAWWWLIGALGGLGLALVAESGGGVAMLRRLGHGAATR